MPDDLFAGNLPGVVAPRDVERFCAEHAEVIRVLGRRVVGDILEIGKRLIAVRDQLPDQNFSGWLRKEFGWSHSTAYNFITAAEAFGTYPTIGQIDIDAGALYLLAGPSVPEPARTEAIERAEAGDRITEQRDRALANVKTLQTRGQRMRPKLPRRRRGLFEHLFADLGRR